MHETTDDTDDGRLWGSRGPHVRRRSGSGACDPLGSPVVFVCVSPRVRELTQIAQGAAPGRRGLAVGRPSLAYGPLPVRRTTAFMVLRTIRVSDDGATDHEHTTMMTLPTDASGFPEGMALAERECTGCGTTGYVPESETHLSHASKCEECTREDFRRYLDPETDTTIGRLNALERIRAGGLLPFRDFDGDLIVAVEVGRGPPGGCDYLKKLKKVVPRECPECGHDRADSVEWRNYTCEYGHHVVCRVCEHTIEEESTL